MINFSWKRIFSLIAKEFLKVRRDPTTLGLILAIPIIQIVLFGYAIDLQPKKLPTAVINYDHSPMTRTFIQALSTSGYFNIKYFPKTELAANRLIHRGKVNFLLNIPSRFTRDLIRGEKPSLLLESDASVPGAMSNALQTVRELSKNVLDRETRGTLDYLRSSEPFLVDIHAKYNPNLETTHTVVPGLLGVILTLSLSLLTSMTITEEKESGTIETLLNSPIQVFEIMLGKFICYLIIGYVQLLAILYLSTHLLFNVPMRGSLFDLLIASLPFLTANLMLGLAASTIAKNQLQAQQMVTFFFLPSILLSGFIFPFYGMPGWAQMVGNMLPLTHYIRIVIGIMIKGYGWHDIIPQLWQIIIFLSVITGLSALAFRKTLVT